MWQSFLDMRDVPVVEALMLMLFMTTEVLIAFHVVFLIEHLYHLSEKKQMSMMKTLLSSLMTCPETFRKKLWSGLHQLVLKLRS